MCIRDRVEGDGQAVLRDIPGLGGVLMWTDGEKLTAEDAAYTYT